jgi:hypothetical protein
MSDIQNGSEVHGNVRGLHFFSNRKDKNLPYQQQITEKRIFQNLSLVFPQTAISVSLSTVARAQIFGAL